MPTYFLNTDSDAERADTIERKVREVIPDLKPIASLEDVAPTITQQANELIYVVIFAPAGDWQQVDRLVDIARRHRQHIFFILISDEISATDYKRLVRTGGADWVATTAAAQEIRDIISKQQVGEPAPGPSARPVVISFVPSAGGVGNSTLAIEAAVQFKKNKTTRDRRICLIDLDFQSSHVCDYLDIEPRLQIREISENPERLDNHLFDIFISRHSSGVDVIAAPRSKFNICELDLAALDALFAIMSTRYDIILVDLPVTWYAWTAQVMAASDGIVVTGFNSIPGLRQIAENLANIRRTQGVSGQIVVALNRCTTGMFGRVANRQHVQSVLTKEKLLYVRDDTAALESINVGIPTSIASPRRTISKDIGAIVAFCSNLQSSRPVLTEAPRTPADRAVNVKDT
jgi:pilus assembly protein CpaE